MSPASLLYISHFLSAWNSRVFQFGSVLLLSALFPGTLFPVSVYALVSALPGALLSKRFGHYIDNNARLPVVRNSILGQRLAVITACAVFASPLATMYKSLTLVVMSAMGGTENSWSIINTVSVERDWVIVVAGSNTDELRRLNSTMRFIDLLCKLLGPFVIGIIDGFYGAQVTAATMLGLSALSCSVEYFAIARVYRAVPALASKNVSEEVEEAEGASEADPLLPSEQEVFSFWKHPLVLVSLAATGLYITVLSFNGQMISFLITTGMDTGTVTLFRTGSAFIELGTTLGAPWVIKRLGSPRSGALFIDYQWTTLLVTAILFISSGVTSRNAALALSVGVALSRIGLWGFDLSTQIIIQDGIRESERGKYSTTEKAMQNWAMIAVYVSTMVFSKPQQFVYPVLMSVIAVGVSTVVYNYWYLNGSRR